MRDVLAAATPSPSPASAAPVEHSATPTPSTTTKTDPSPAATPKAFCAPPTPLSRNDRSRTAGFCGVVAGCPAWRSIARSPAPERPRPPRIGGRRRCLSRSIPTCGSPRSAEFLLAPC